MKAGLMVSVVNTQHPPVSSISISSQVNLNSIGFGRFDPEHHTVVGKRQIAERIFEVGGANTAERGKVGRSTA